MSNANTAYDDSDARIEAASLLHDLTHETCEVCAGHGFVPTAHGHVNDCDACQGEGHIDRTEELVAQWSREAGEAHASSWVSPPGRVVDEGDGVFSYDGEDDIPFLRGALYVQHGPRRRRRTGGSGLRPL
jgi:hypothetical protein